MNPDELDLVPVDDLKAAFLRRFDHVIVAGFSPAEGVEEVSWGWRGDPYRVIGLMEEIKHRLFAQQQEIERA
jgi:hypothetical protein